MKFIDTAEIQVKAGDGGAGMSHFRREANVAFGGPDGGNGGRGGNIIFQGDEGLHTLLDFRFNRIHEAKDGGKGGTNNRQGGVGDDLILKVPCGTVVFDADSGEPIGEVIKHEQQLIVAHGGKGGVGNHVFVSSSNQAPTKTIPPGMGERKGIRLELKMLADVGIIGAPNAGKSTLITVISAARPKVADYPFTTLVPNLGVVSHKDADPFVVADVPGLIPGASEGKGLGHDFLRHIERTRVLIHLVDASQESAEAMIQDFEGILSELALYDQELLKRPRLTVLSKLDLVVPENESEYLNEEAIAGFRNYLKGKGVEFIEVSSARRMGISDMLDQVVELLHTLREGQ
ncbi:GTPase ObgE [bacterium]|nr:GTPase ObgE [bacterium]